MKARTRDCYCHACTLETLRVIELAGHTAAMNTDQAEHDGKYAEAEVWKAIADALGLAYDHIAHAHAD